MTPRVILFGLAAGGAIGLFIPKIFGVEDLGVANLVTAVLGAIAGLLAMGAIIHFYGRLQ